MCTGKTWGFSSGHQQNEESSRLAGRSCTRENDDHEILGTALTVSIYGHSKELQLPTSLAKTWILNELF